MFREKARKRCPLSLRPSTLTRGTLFRTQGVFQNERRLNDFHRRFPPRIS